MRKLLLEAIIALLYIVVFVNGSDKRRNIFNGKKYITAERILNEFQEDVIVRKCSSPFLCWPGRCFVVERQQFCSCPEGFISEFGRCVRKRKKCQNFSCYPGQCYKRNDSSSCLCPEGYYSDRGICKEFQWICKVKDCKPGKCIKEFNVEKCLCPEGFTAKARQCVEIAYTSTKQVSTIMLMIIVAIASVMLTTFFGVCVCYYTRRDNY